LAHPFSGEPAPEPTDMALSRRGFIVGTVGASVALALPTWAAGAAGAAGAPTAADFQEVCAALANGRKVVGPDAPSYLAALTGPGEGDALGALVKIVRTTPPGELDAAIRAKGLDELANEIVAMVYSGETGTGDKIQVVSYEDALVWDALPYTKPSAECGGEFGYWSAPGS